MRREHKSALMQTEETYFLFQGFWTNNEFLLQSEISGSVKIGLSIKRYKYLIYLLIFLLNQLRLYVT